MTKMSRKFFVLAFWLAAAFAFVMATIPQPPALPGQPSDKVQHILAFSVLASLAFTAWPWKRWPLIVVGLSAFGALIEMVQLIPALHRDGDCIDWLADTAAVLVVAGITYFRRRYSPVVCKRHHRLNRS